MEKPTISRRKWTQKQRDDIVKESLMSSGEAVINKYKLSSSLFYKWKKEYMKVYAQKEMMMPRYKDHKSDAEKEQIVEESYVTSVKDVMEKYNLAASMVYKWRKQFTHYTGPQDVTPTTSDLPSMKLNPIIGRIKNIEELVDIRWKESSKLYHIISEDTGDLLSRLVALDARIAAVSARTTLQEQEIHYEINKKSTPKSWMLFILRVGVISLITHLIFKAFGI